MLQLFRRFSSVKVNTGDVPSIIVNNKSYKPDEWTNVPNSILQLTNRKLHLDENHPIGILRSLIEDRFKGLGYTYYNEFEPVVSTFENFDVLNFPKDHPGRSKSDTYYLNKDMLLRTHTSAHEYACFKKCETPGYFISADVYRKDEIDKTHYPAFHQMEGARIWERSKDFEQKIKDDINAIPKLDMIVEDDFPCFDPITNPKQDYMTPNEVELVSTHLKRTIELLIYQVFSAAKENAIIEKKINGKISVDEAFLNEPLRVKWIPDYFPWTAPSWEIDVWWKGEWLECCGCGLVRQKILTNSGISPNTVGWAFGVGLDRIAMLLFGIPDIRLFWTLDERFKSQFIKGKITSFKPYSKYPATIRDVAFWLPQDNLNLNEPLHENDLMEIVRETAGDLVESVKLIDEFIHPKTNRKSQCYRIQYQSMDRNLTNEEINILQETVRLKLQQKYNIELR